MSKSNISHLLSENTEDPGPFQNPRPLPRLPQSMPVLPSLQRNSGQPARSVVAGIASRKEPEKQKNPEEQPMDRPTSARQAVPESGAGPNQGNVQGYPGQSTGPQGSVNPQITHPLNAPSLTSFIQHIHYYTFNAPCTIHHEGSKEGGGIKICTEPGTYKCQHRTEVQTDGQQPAEAQVENQGQDKNLGRASQEQAGSATQHLTNLENSAARTVSYRARNFPQVTKTPGNISGPCPSTDLRTTSSSRLASPDVEGTQGPLPILPISTRNIHSQAVESGKPTASPTFPAQNESEPPFKRRAVRANASVARSLDLVTTTKLPVETHQRQPSIPVAQGIHASSRDVSQVQLCPPSGSKGNTPGSSTPYITAETSVMQLEAREDPNSKRLSREDDKVKKDRDHLKDWHTIIEMYETGAHTRDGIPLKNIVKGSTEGSNMDRKLLEKYRTIGSTYALLGKETFEIAIGYTADPETGLSRRTPLYQVTPRCRIIKELYKNDALPKDPHQLRDLVTRREAEKERLRLEAARAAESSIVVANEGNRDVRRSMPELPVQGNRGSRVRTVSSGDILPKPYKPPPK